MCFTLRHHGCLQASAFWQLWASSPRPGLVCALAPIPDRRLTIGVAAAKQLARPGRRRAPGRGAGGAPVGALRTVAELAQLSLEQVPGVAAGPWREFMWATRFLSRMFVAGFAFLHVLCFLVSTVSSEDFPGHTGWSLGGRAALGWNQRPACRTPSLPGHLLGHMCGAAGVRGVVCSAAVGEGREAEGPARAAVIATLAAVTLLGLTRSLPHCQVLLQ